MLRIRLARTGAKNDPHYRIIVIEKTKKRGGEAVDVVGNWYPKKNQLNLDKKKLEEWQTKGAQISEAVQKIFNK